MKILEYILRIIVFLIEKIGDSKSIDQPPPNINHQVENSEGYSPKLESGVNSTIRYTDKVKDTLDKIIESHNEIHRQDLDEIKRLRTELSELQIEIMYLRSEIVQEKEKNKDLQEELNRQMDKKE